MITIGITGGVGAGKSKILAFIEENYNCRVLRADEIAHLLEEPGQPCYEGLVALFGREIVNGEGYIDKKKLAEKIFSDEQALVKVNALIHPEVKKYVIQEIAQEQKAKKYDYFFLEAALLIEEHYDEILDTLWYIHTDRQIREQRLIENRHYSTEKVADIMRGQLSEEEFRKHCSVEIENNGDLSKTFEQIKRVMKDSLMQ